MNNNVTVETIYAVLVTDRMDGLYLFLLKEDAHRFHKAVLANGGDADMTEEPINHTVTTTELVEQENDS
jgi:hypothetical protein